MKRTGKFGFITSELTDEEVRQQAGLNLAKLIDDGRNYSVNLSFLRCPAMGATEVFIETSGHWKCRVTVCLVDYRDTQVGEHCIVPTGRAELARFDVRLREPTPEETAEDEDALLITQYILESPPMSFEGVGMWRRVE